MATESYEKKDEPRYPHIEVQLIGEDGNAFAIMGAVSKALRADGIDASLIKQYQEECMSGDYSNLLYVTMCWITIL